MDKRYLILNCDDFGASEEVNLAVRLACRRGVLTSASLMPGGAAFDGAVRLARENPRSAVGIHVTCVHGKSVLPHCDIPSLVDCNGNFPSDPALASLKYFFCKRARKELFRELRAQFERFFASGLDCSHIDSHCHMHVNPAVLGLLVELGGQYNVKRMRVPEDDFFAAAPFLSEYPAKAGYAIVFKLLASSMRARLRGHGFKTPLKVYGNLLTGSMSRSYVLSLLESLPAGVSEIYFHPAVLPANSEADPRNAQHLRELGILIDREVRSRMDRIGIIPATYFDLDRA